MTPEQVLEKMLEIYGSEQALANPEHYPRTFKHQVDLAKWILSLPKTEQPDTIEGEQT